MIFQKYSKKNGNRRSTKKIIKGQEISQTPTHSNTIGSEIRERDGRKDVKNASKSIGALPLDRDGGQLKRTVWLGCPMLIWNGYLPRIDWEWAISIVNRK